MWHVRIFVVCELNVNSQCRSLAGQGTRHLIVSARWSPDGQRVMLGCPEWRNAEVLMGWTQLEHLFFSNSFFTFKFHWLHSQLMPFLSMFWDLSEAWKFRISIRKNCCFGNVLLTWRGLAAVMELSAFGSWRIWIFTEVVRLAQPILSLTKVTITKVTKTWKVHEKLSPVERLDHLDLEMSRLWWFAPFLGQETCVSIRWASTPSGRKRWNILTERKVHSEAPKQTRSQDPIHPMHHPTEEPKKS